MEPADHEQSGQPVGYWWVVFSLALGAIVLGAFMPVFLFVAAGAVIWIPVQAMREARDAKRLQEQLHASREQTGHERHIAALLRGVINGADIPIIATDEHGVLAHTNRRAKKVLGIGEALVGRPFDELVTQPVLHELEALARAGEPGHARVPIPIGGEMREFDISADPVPISEGAVLTFRDITELSRAMTLKADFAANASHELRTPIASIKGAAETLSGPARHDEKMADRLIEMITSNATRLELLAADLLDLSKLEAEDQPPEIAPVDLHGLIDRVIGDYQTPAERRQLTVVAQIEDGLDEILTDPALLMLILRNLVGNAIKFAHEGTRVKICADRRKVAPDRSIPIPDELGLAMGVRLRVIDKGVGIPLAHQHRIFERFYQVDEARTGSGAKRGTGLGLAIVKHASKRLGGTVGLESVHQVGTTMIVDLPRCAQESPGAPSQEAR